MRKRALGVLPWLVAGGMSASVWADAVHLKDGGKVEGALVRDGAGWVVVDETGKRTFVGDDQVKSIEKTSSLSPAELSDSRLGTLRRAVGNLSDLDQIIERYSRFIEENKGQPAAEEAKADLAAWREKQNKGMVKVGSSWVTSEERQKMLEQSAKLVDDAREQIKSNRMRDAEETVNQLLTVDPKNASGLYLRGVLMFKQGQLGQAKKSFEGVKEQLTQDQTDHGPTLNNLAVILSQQKQAMRALVLYDQAMQASPGNRQILDNVAEALEAIPQEQHKNSVYTRAAKRFAEQDAELAKEMQKEGLYRWGSSWIDAKQMEEVKAAQAKVKEKLDQLVADYDRIKERVKEIETQIDLNDRTMQRIRNDSQRYDRRDGGGVRVVRLPLPSIYYDMKREQDKLEIEQDGLLAKLQTFADKERAIRQDVPVPQFTGKQRIVETEGTPLAAVDIKKSPATRPATR